MDPQEGGRLRRSYSLLRTSISLLVLFLVLLLVFSLIVVPTLHWFASKFFNPRTVKNSWDSLNLVLVLFAIVCGFFRRNNTNTTSETQTPRSPRTFSNPLTPPSAWFQNDYSQIHNGSFNRLRRFDPYPDLLQQIAADARFQFNDDTYLLRHRHRHRHMRTDPEEEEQGIGIDNVTTAPPQQGTEVIRRNVIIRHEANGLPVMDSQPPPVTRTYQTETMEKRETNDFDAQNSQPSPSPPCPPPATRTRGVRRNSKPEGNDSVVKSSPPPPAPSPPLPEEGRTVTGKKRRGGAIKECLKFLRRKKRKQRQKSVENFDSILSSELISQPPQPSPPPRKVFQKLFSWKKGKHKNRQSDPVAPTTRTSVSNKREHGSSSNVIMASNDSPLNPIPPLPPFKFEVRGTL